MCQVLGVSRAAYYRWRKAGPSEGSLGNQALNAQIHTIYQALNRSYGSPRICTYLRRQGQQVSRIRVAKLMRAMGLRADRKRKFTATTDSNHPHRISAHLLERDFRVGEIGRVWCSDITYVPTAQGWLYLTVIMDLGDRRIIGWSIAEGLKAVETVIPAWKMALSNRTPAAEMIFHSDRGVQYACDPFRAHLAKVPSLRQSMSRKGNCWDNAVVESFFKSLKAEGLSKSTLVTKQK